jgi:hypothetical protein
MVGMPELQEQIPASLELTTHRKNCRSTPACPKLPIRQKVPEQIPA